MFEENPDVSGLALRSFVRWDVRVHLASFGLSGDGHKTRKPTLYYSVRWGSYFAYSFSNFRLHVNMMMMMMMMIIIIIKMLPEVF